MKVGWMCVDNYFRKAYHGDVNIVSFFIIVLLMPLTSCSSDEKKSNAWQEIAEEK